MAWCLTPQTPDPEVEGFEPHSGFGVVSFSKTYLPPPPKKKKKKKKKKKTSTVIPRKWWLHPIMTHFFFRDVIHQTKQKISRDVYTGMVTSMNLAI